MRSVTRVLPAVVLLAAICASPPYSMATDIDGPDDCIQAHIDEGDAPEGITAYATGVIGCFPTCVGPGPLSTMEVFCPPISTPPGPAGYVEHFQYPTLPPFWLGCYPTLGPVGFDNETNGKVSVGLPPGMPPPPFSACMTSLPIDCVETAADGLKFGQDECYADGSDAGVTTFKTFAVCSADALTFTATSCPSGQVRQVILNILVDWNADGDWNDNFSCGVGIPCAYEWAVKNAVITLLPGCNTITSPSFLAGPNVGPGWMRVTLTKDPVGDSFPWAAAALDGGAYEGGETEDYPVFIEGPTPVEPSTWGRIKSRYL